CHGSGLSIFTSITGELNRCVTKRLKNLTESKGARLSYLSNAIEIDGDRNLFPHFTRLMDDFTFRADDYGASIAQLAGTVYINEITLIRYGICLSNNQFLCSINGSSHGGMKSDLGALPHQRASRFWHPPVIADGDPKATNLWNIEGDELRTGFHSLFIG